MLSSNSKPPKSPYSGSRFLSTQQPPSFSISRSRRQNAVSSHRAPFSPSHSLSFTTPNKHSASPALGALSPLQGTLMRYSLHNAPHSDPSHRLVSRSDDAMTSPGILYGSPLMRSRQPRTISSPRSPLLKYTLQNTSRSLSRSNTTNSLNWHQHERRSTSPRRGHESHAQGFASSNTANSLSSFDGRGSPLPHALTSLPKNSLLKDTLPRNTFRKAPPLHRALSHDGISKPENPTASRAVNQSVQMPKPRRLLSAPEISLQTCDPESSLARTAYPHVHPPPVEPCLSSKSGPALSNQRVSLSMHSEDTRYRTLPSFPLRSAFLNDTPPRTPRARSEHLYRFASEQKTEQCEAPSSTFEVGCHATSSTQQRNTSSRSRKYCANSSSSSSQMSTRVTPSHNGMPRKQNKASAKIKSKNMAAEHAENDIAALRHAHQPRRATFQAVDTMLTELEGDDQAYARELDALKQRYEQQIAELNDELEMKETQCEDHTSTSEQSLSLIKELQRVKRSLEQNIEELSDERSQLQTQNHSFRDQNNALQHELQEFSQQNNAKESRIAELEAKNAELVVKQRDLSVRVAEVLEANSRLEKRFDDSQTCLDALSRRLREKADLLDEESAINETLKTEHAEERKQWQSALRKQNDAHQLGLRREVNKWRATQGIREERLLEQIEKFKARICELQQRWVPDERADSCQQANCLRPFTFFRRRHHCRTCGRVLCSRCCPPPGVLQGYHERRERVCIECVDGKAAECHLWRECCQ